MGAQAAGQPAAACQVLRRVPPRQGTAAPPRRQIPPAPAVQTASQRQPPRQCLRPVAPMCPAPPTGIIRLQAVEINQHQGILISTYPASTTFKCGLLGSLWQSVLHLLQVDMHCSCISAMLLQKASSAKAWPVLGLLRAQLTLARYFSSLDTTVNNTSRAGRAMPYATTCMRNHHDVGNCHFAGTTGGSVTCQAARRAPCKNLARVLCWALIAV